MLPGYFLLCSLIQVCVDKRDRGTNPVPTASAALGGGGWRGPCAQGWGRLVAHRHTPDCIRPPHLGKKLERGNLGHVQRDRTQRQEKGNRCCLRKQQLWGAGTALSPVSGAHAHTSRAEEWNPNESGWMSTSHKQKPSPRQISTPKSCFSSGRSKALKSVPGPAAPEVSGGLGSVFMSCIWVFLST